ncbi:MAG: TlpA family protein disulfide reductase [Acidobacteriia bacterium]|nr:TlpA family protein disulfide reductase [Terriglobia bacterium]
MRTILTILLCSAALFAADPIRRAPGFSLMDSNGQLHDLADYRGKVVVLEFMQTTCPHCAAFAPILQQVQQKYGDKIAIIAVTDPPDNLSTLSAYVAGHKVTYPVVLDCGQAAYSYVRSRTLNFPHVYLIDGAGMIRNDYEYGPLTRDIFEGKALFLEIDRLLGGAATPAKRR